MPAIPRRLCRHVWRSLGPRTGGLGPRLAHTGPRLWARWPPLRPVGGNEQQNLTPGGVPRSTCVGTCENVLGHAASVCCWRSRCISSRMFFAKDQRRFLSTARPQINQYIVFRSKSIKCFSSLRNQTPTSQTSCSFGVSEGAVRLCPAIQRRVGGARAQTTRPPLHARAAGGRCAELLWPRPPPPGLRRGSDSPWRWCLPAPGFRKLGSLRD